MGEPTIKLIHCPACSRQISEQARECPACAQPVGEEVMKRNAFKAGRIPLRDGFGFLDYLPMTRNLSQREKKIITWVIGGLLLLVGIGLVSQELIQIFR